MLNRFISNSLVRQSLRSSISSTAVASSVLRSSSTNSLRTYATASPEEVEELRQATIEFCKAEIPREVAFQTDQENAFPNHLWRKMGDAGLLGITAPEEYGGLKAGYLAHVVVMEELSRASGSIALSYSAHAQLCVNQLSLHTTKEQAEKYLPDLISGRKIGALAMSETGSGSDVVSMKTRADPSEDGSGYVLNGTKMWITNGPDADTIVVYAKTNPSAGSKGITAFIVEKGMPGFSCTRKLDKFGMRGSNTGELVFDNVFVPKENILGELNQGVYVLMSGLDYERLVLSAGPIGLMRAALDEVLPYVHQRKQFGTPIGEFQLMQGKLADMYTKMAASRAYIYETARQADAGTLKSMDSSGAILYAAERASEVCLDAIQAMGGMGYMNETSVGRLLRDAKLYEIGAGTSEVRRIVIGRAFNKEYKQ